MVIVVLVCVWVWSIQLLNMSGRDVDDVIRKRRSMLDSRSRLFDSVDSTDACLMVPPAHDVVAAVFVFGGVSLLLNIDVIGFALVVVVEVCCKKSGTSIVRDLIDANLTRFGVVAVVDDHLSTTGGFGGFVSSPIVSNLLV
jgi:hypothetical protein